MSFKSVSQTIIGTKYIAVPVSKAYFTARPTREIGSAEIVCVFVLSISKDCTNVKQVLNLFNRIMARNMSQTNVSPDNGCVSGKETVFYMFLACLYFIFLDANWQPQQSR